MSKCSFIVNLTSTEVMNRVKDEQDAEMIFEEFHDLGNGKDYGTLIFDKYFMRVSNRVALVVMVNNLNGKTQVTSVATGSAQGRVFKFDWGAGDDFSESVRSILKQYIIEEIDD